MLNNGPSPLPTTNVQFTYPASVKDGGANDYVLYLSSVSDLGANNTRCNLAGLVNPGNLISVSKNCAAMTLRDSVCVHPSLPDTLLSCLGVPLCMSV